MTNFREFNLPDNMMEALDRMGYSTATPVQAESIPLALNGEDVLGSAQTGTGKTGAFTIPMIAHLLKNPTSQGIIITPTRELASQVMAVVAKLAGRRSGIRTALLIGGEPMPKQLFQLKAKPRLIVGTPGRINDHLERGKLKLSGADFLVLDETDRMLDMGFSVQIDEILKHMPEKRQTLMFSATLAKGIVEFAQKYLVNPKRVSIDPESILPEKINQEIIHLKESEKYERLVKELDARDGTIVIFAKTKYGTDALARRLNDDNFEARPIHGDLRQHKRERTLKAFRNKRYRILVATDVAARGLDIPHIEHVINYDLPHAPEDYIHRIGRTARAGAEGVAISFITPDDRRRWNAIQRILDPEKFARENSGRGGRGRGRSDRGGRGRDDNRRRRSDRNERSGSRSRRRDRNEGGEERSDSFGFKSDRRSSRGNTSDRSRGENRGGGRSESRNESRGGSRGEKRSGGRSENRSESRGGKRDFGRKSDNRRSGGRSRRSSR